MMLNHWKFQKVAESHDRVGQLGGSGCKQGDKENNCETAPRQTWLPFELPRKLADLLDFVARSDSGLSVTSVDLTPLITAITVPLPKTFPVFTPFCLLKKKRKSLRQL